METVLKNIWTESFKINSPLVNPLGKLGLYGCLNLLQETAWMHAENLGFGMNDMEKQGLYWVLTRQNLQMKSWPKFGENISVSTWLRPPENGFVSREFKIFKTNDPANEIGLCTTSWLALDRKTKKILPSLELRPWDEISNPQTTHLVAEKLVSNSEYIKLAKFRVRNSDLDINQHVNNTKYSQWILDSIPYQLHKRLKLNGYSVNFLAETHLGDEVQIDRSADSPDGFTADRGVTDYRGLRLSDQKVLFTARLEWTTSNLDVLR